MVKLLLFTFLYNLIANWIQIYYLGKNLFNPIKKDPLQDEISLELKERMESVTGLDLKIKIIAENKKAIGFMMTSPPFPPVMLFSKRLYDLFNDEEMEWVILHESGHYIFKHNLKLILLDIVFSVINAFIIYKFELPIVIALSFTICIALIQIQLAKLFEYEADRFAASKMRNPQGMISGNIKMKKANKTFNNSKFLKKLLVIAVPYDKRIQIAKNEIENRRL